jgi:hypothetical protein
LRKKIFGKAKRKNKLKDKIDVDNGGGIGPIIMEEIQKGGLMRNGISER